MRTAVVSFGVLFFSLCVLAGEYVMNEDAARGLRVVFSEPVFITGFGDVLANVTPEGEASEFTFYGGELEPWVGHWMSWKPATAVLVRSEWLSGAPGTFEEEATQREAQVTGQLLNAAYFAHPAYVMQGVSDRDRVFAMPLAGISELGFYPLRSGVSPDAVAWCVEVNDQGLIEATIDAGVLYIWAATDRSAGAGTATLTAALASGEEAQATIPVTVFRRDKTLTHPSGKRDYFVPWSYRLDINRILSVRKHAGEYGFEDISRLDCSVRFSRWRPMPRLHDVEKSIMWENELVSDGFWPKAAQLRLTTAFLSEFADLGVNAIRIETPMYIKGRSGVEIYPEYRRRLVGPTMRSDELAYFINEAHRLGLMVVASTQVWGDRGSSELDPFETYEFIPDDPQAFWDNYRALQRDQTEKQVALGVEFLSVGFNLHLVGSRCGQEAMADEQMRRIIEDAREQYPGPITYFGGSLWYRIGEIWNADFRFWTDLDILTTGMVHNTRPLTDAAEPSIADLVEEWEWRIEEYFQPFQAKYGKPLIAHENGCYSVQGSLPWGSFYWVRSHVNLYALPVSTREQELHYESFLRAFEDEDWFYGPGFFWVHFAPGREIGGINDRSMSFRAKPAEQVMTEYYNPTAPKPANTQDGSTEDWPESALWVEDPEGDTSGVDDILNFAVYQDTTHIYAAIEYSATPRGNIVIGFDVNGDDEEDYFLSGGSLAPGFPMEVYLQQPNFEDRSADVTLGIADCAVAGTVIEVRLHKAFLPGDWETVRAALSDLSENWAQTEDWVRGIHEIPLVLAQESG